MKALLFVLAFGLATASSAGTVTNFECHSRQNGADLFGKITLEETGSLKAMTVTYQENSAGQQIECSGPVSRFAAKDAEVYLLRCANRDYQHDLLLEKVSSGWHLSGKTVLHVERKTIPDYICRKR